MAKTSSTVHLEESTWKEINEYREKYDCSRNEAIERMFTERRLLLNMNLKEKNSDKVDPIVNREDIDIAVGSVYDDMPD